MIWYSIVKSLGLKMLRKMGKILHHSKHGFSSSTVNYTSPLNRPNLIDLVSSGQLKEALLEMAVQGLEMRFKGYDTLLNECVSRRAIREGQRVHAHMIKSHYHPPVYLRTRLVIFYAKCECLGDARRVLDEMPDRNVVSWTAMISAYAQRGYASEARNLFVQMLRSGILFEHRFRS